MKLRKIVLAGLCCCLLCGCASQTELTSSSDNVAGETSAVTTTSTSQAKVEQTTTQSTTSSVKQTNKPTTQTTTTTMPAAPIRETTTTSSAKVESKKTITPETTTNNRYAITEENQRHEKAIREIENRYTAKIAAEQGAINSLKSMYGVYYSASYYSEKYNTLIAEINQKERKLQLLQMSSGSKTEIQRLQHDISDMRKTAANYAQCKTAAEEISKCENNITRIRREMQSKIDEENTVHQRTLNQLNG